MSDAFADLDQVPPERVEAIFAQAVMVHGPKGAEAVWEAAAQTLWGMHQVSKDQAVAMIDAAEARLRARGLTGRASLVTLAATLDGWDVPVPLAAVTDLPSFPAGVFPVWLENMVTETAEFTQTPRDLSAMVVLGTLAAACGGRAIVQVKPGWSEPLNLYVVTALPSGARKSPVYSALTGPLLGVEQQLAQETAERITEARTARAVADKAASAAAKKAANVAADPDKTTDEKKKAAEDATAAALLVEAATIPVVPRLIADDITPEKIPGLMADQGGRLAVLSDEGGPLVSLIGRYSKEPNLNVWLKGHNGLHAELRVDRVGRPPEYVSKPALTVCVTVQPGVLRKIYQTPELREFGMLARFLYSMPHDLVGYRKTRVQPVSEQAALDYVNSMFALARTWAEWTDPAGFQLAPGALEMLLQNMEAAEPRLRPDAPLGHIRDWASKRHGAVARIAGLLHAAAYLGNAYQVPVGEDTMSRALAIGEYLTAHALAAFAYMGEDSALGDARAIFAWIRASGRQQFSRRDVHYAMRGRFAKAEDTDPALEILSANGWIRKADDEPKRGPGRPSIRFDVHPAALEK